MKFQKLLTFLFALLLVTSMTSCDKDDDNGPSKRDFLTAGQWKGQSVWWGEDEITSELRNDEEYPFDVTQLSYKFDKAGTYLVTFKGQTDNGTWEFVNNEQSILMNKGTSFETTLKVLKITDKEFNYIDPYDETGQLDLEFRFTR
ncbi:hypothetical protein [Pontibacter amylolyticus]|nr:hypothetical protein [Pontibacter amylolyticus]